MGLRALFLVLLSLMAPAGAPAAESPWTGFNGIASFAGRISHDAVAREGAAAGATSGRAVVDWAWLEPAPRQYAWGDLDAYYRASLAHGLRPLIGITGAPRWAWARGAACAAEHCAHPPARTRLRAYGRLFRAVAERYPQAAAIQVGNEPNLEWAWAGGVSPRRYTQMLKVAYRSVKAVAPDMPVIAAGLAPVLREVRNAREMGLRQFLRGMYANGARGHMDGLAVHPYPESVDFQQSFTALSVVKDVRADHGDDVPIWVTEVGMSTSTFEPAVQATVLPTLVAALREDPDVAGVYVHTLHDDPANPVERERGFGVRGADGLPKPAYCALSKAWGGEASCATVEASAVQQARWEAQVLLQAAADAARRARAQTGSYEGVTSADLHRQDPRISERPAPGALLPALATDPAQIGVYALGPDTLVVCNRSAGGLSYCLGSRWARRWVWESTTGSVFATAGSLLTQRAARAPTPPPAPTTPR